MFDSCVTERINSWDWIQTPLLIHGASITSVWALAVQSRHYSVTALCALNHFWTSVTVVCGVATLLQDVPPRHGAAPAFTRCSFRVAERAGHGRLLPVSFPLPGKKKSVSKCYSSNFHTPDLPGGSLRWYNEGGSCFLLTSEGTWALHTLCPCDRTGPFTPLGSLSSVAPLYLGCYSIGLLATSEAPRLIKCSEPPCVLGIRSLPACGWARWPPGLGRSLSAPADQHWLLPRAEGGLRLGARQGWQPCSLGARHPALCSPLSPQAAPHKLGATASARNDPSSPVPRGSWRQSSGSRRLLPSMTISPPLGWGVL